MTKNEVAHLGNLLNEVLHGFAISDWEVEMRHTKNETRLLLQRLHDSYHAASDDAVLNLEFSRDEIEMLSNSGRLCLAEFEDAEYQTRVGDAKQYTQDLLQKLMPRSSKR